MSPISPEPRSSLLPSLIPCLLLFQCGAIYSLGLFNAAAEAYTPSSTPLPSAWSSAMSYMSLSCTAFMIITGLLLVRAPPTSKLLIMRLLTFLSSLAFAALSLAPFAVRSASLIAINLIIAAQGIPFAFLYLVALELLAVWNPQCKGFATGIGQMMFGLGSMAYAVIYDGLVSSFNFSGALTLTAVILSLPIVLLTFLLSLPPRQPTHDSIETPSPHVSLSSSIFNLVGSQSFWLYVLSAFGAQAGFAFIPFFPKLSTGFQITSSTATAAFDLVFLVTSLLRPVAGVLIDCLGIGNGAFSMGSKNLMCLLLGFQMLLFGILPWTVEYGGYWPFVAVVGGILGVFACAACVVAVLARDLFGEERAIAALGIGGALALGVGEFSSTQLMAVFARRSTSSEPAVFKLFYLIAAVWSGFSLVAAVRMQKSTEKRREDFVNKWAEGRDAERGEYDAMYRQNVYEAI